MHGGTVEVGFDFIAELVGRGVVAAEVDNMARVVRFRTVGEFEEIQGVGPATRERLHKLEDAFDSVSVRVPDLLKLKKRS